MRCGEGEKKKGDKTVLMIYLVRFLLPSSGSLHLINKVNFLAHIKCEWYGAKKTRAEHSGPKCKGRLVLILMAKRSLYLL